MARSRRSIAFFTPHAAALVAALALFVTLGHAQQGPDYHDDRGYPEGERGKSIQNLIEVVSSNDASRAKALVESGFAPAFRDSIPIDEHVGQILGIYDTSHGYDFHGIRR